MTRGLKRLLRHCMASRWTLARVFPRDALLAIEAAIRTSEATHAGELRFVVEAALDGAALWHGQSARERAIDVFSELRVWDTERNSGVLIYLLLADSAVEIVADRGITARVDAEVWRTVCRNMEADFRRGNHERGVIDGIRAVSSCLESAFPPVANERNELPDRPVTL